MRRLGTFRISRFIVDEILDGKISGLTTQSVLNIFKDVFIFDIKINVIEDYNEYTAYHPDFDIVKTGEKIPEYLAIFDSKHTYPKWKKII